MKKTLAPAFAAALICVPLAAMAQLPSLKNLPSLPGVPAAGTSAGGGDVGGQNDSLVRGYVAANTVARTRHATSGRSSTGARSFVTAVTK